MAKTAKKTSKEKTALEIPLEELLEAGCHFGHIVAKVHPRMKEYIYMAREGVHIFDLVKTRENLQEAISFLQMGQQEPFVNTGKSSGGNFFFTKGSC